MKFIKIAFFLLLFTEVAFAQIIPATEPIFLPVNGYIVTLSNDTLYGKINVRKVSAYVTEINFKDEFENKQKYSPEMLLAFCQKRPLLLRDFSNITTLDKDFVHYESRPHPKKEDKLVFMERLLNGDKVKLFDNPTGAKSSTSVGNMTVKESSLNYVVLKEGSKPFILRKKNYDQEFANLFGDCTSFIEWAYSQPERKKFKQIAMAINQYNHECK